MDRIVAQNGDGIATLGLKKQGDGSFIIKAVCAEIEGEDPYFRKSGMGGARYVRHCLESSILNRGGSWLPPAIERAIEVLEIIDGRQELTAGFELWSYRHEGGDKVIPIGESAWVSDPSADFELDQATERDFNWPLLFQDVSDHAAEELTRDLLMQFWGRPIPAPNGNLSDVQNLTALLTHQALLERQFLVACATDSSNAWPIFHELVSARYIRTLCLLHRCAATDWKQEILWPDITELGRTILLLSCCGWLKEANELAQRSKPMILSYQNQFVPLVPWFGIAWGAQSSEVFSVGAVHKFDSNAYDDAAWLLDHWQTNDLEDLSERLVRFAARRSNMIGQFDDEYHIDFDDGFSWTIPYEVGAILMARKSQGLSIPRLDHPLFELPPAQFELAEGGVKHFQQVYADFVRGS